MKAPIAVGIVVSALMLVGAQENAPREMEALGRGVVTIRQSEGDVFVSWRRLGTEAPDTAFNLYRVSGRDRAVRLNSTPLSGPTHYIDRQVDVSRDTAYSAPDRGRRREALTTC